MRKFKQGQRYGGGFELAPRKPAVDTVAERHMEQLAGINIGSGVYDEYIIAKGCDAFELLGFTGTTPRGERTYTPKDFALQRWTKDISHDPSMSRKILMVTTNDEQVWIFEARTSRGAAPVHNRLLPAMCTRDVKFNSVNTRNTWIEAYAYKGLTVAFSPVEPGTHTAVRMSNYHFRAKDNGVGIVMSPEGGRGKGDEVEVVISATDGLITIADNPDRLTAVTDLEISMSANNRTHRDR